VHQYAADIFSRFGSYEVTMNLTLYSHPLSSYCWKVLIALYENGTPFDARMVNLGDPGAKAAFKTLWPTAKIPLLEDRGEVVPETSIMIEHIEQRYPGKVCLIPQDPHEQLNVRLWDRLFDLYVMAPMQRFIAQQLRPATERDATIIAESLTELRNAYDMIEDRRGNRDWAAGKSFSMADCAAAPALFYARIVAPFSSSHVNLAHYFDRLMARPSVKRVITEARPYFQYFPLHHSIPAHFLSDATGTT
jgi:glutathione S-transferase